MVRFARADADLRLLGKGRLPEGAFRGKAVWIVGASQGLGEVLAQQLAQQGARLILTARNEQRLRGVRDACVRSGCEDVVVLPLDVCAPDADLANACAAADAAFGGAGVDVLLYNSGASQHAAAEDTSAGVMRSMVELNTLAPLRLTRCALSGMLARHSGHIVLVSSMSALVPAPGQALYAGSKAALTAYFLSLLSELCARGINVTIAYPGPIATGSPDAPRNVFGPEGLAAASGVHGGDKKRMDPGRVAELVLLAAHHRLHTAWIAKHPVLLLAYLVQYLPSLGLAVMKRIGPGRAAQLKGGASGYDWRKMLFEQPKAKPA